MNQLTNIPTRIYSKPNVTTNKIGERFVILDFIMYKITNDDITENDLLMVWYKSKTKNDDRTSIKNIIFKGNKTHKMKIINHTELYCDCDIFKNKNDCRHIGKLKKYFDMEKGG